MIDRQNFAAPILAQPKPATTKSKIIFKVRARPDGGDPTGAATNGLMAP